MLHEFLTDHRDELVTRCRAKVAKRRVPRPTDMELDHGVPQFLEQLIRTLQVEERMTLGISEQVAGASERGRISGSPDPASDPPAPSEMSTSATKHGNELLGRGFTVDQVVHDYGDLCQSVTELALERKAPVTTDEFRTLNRCLDSAIAAAVTEYSRQRDLRISGDVERANNERLGVFAHELRNALNTASLAINAIKKGDVGFGGATGAVFDRSMKTLRDLVDRSLAQVRLAAGIVVMREKIPLSEFVEELQVAAAMEANARGVQLNVMLVDYDLVVEADRHILASAVSNLLSNAIKFTRDGGLVSLRVDGSGDRILIEVEDECGGLATDKIEDLFVPFEQQSADRSGLGLGLAISRRGVEANGGELQARSVAGKGCVFTVELPKASAVRSGSSRRSAGQTR
ncbi:MAG: histidine kinase, gyrase and HSP90-like ATPase family protein [Myxococcales bacterium]|nr:histidine kinase, gyrase and HSP90-like ATPase family protein [Myxococcales bacterium]